MTSQQELIDSIKGLDIKKLRTESVIEEVKKSQKDEKDFELKKLKDLQCLIGDYELYKKKVISLVEKRIKDSILLDSNVKKVRIEIPRDWKNDEYYEILYCTDWKGYYTMTLIKEANITISVYDYVKEFFQIYCSCIKFESFTRKDADYNDYF